MHKIWACVSAGACATSFVTAALPFLQFLAVIISIAAGIKAWRHKSK